MKNTISRKTHLADLGIYRHIGLDKVSRGYLVNIFLISPRKRMLWVLIRSASARRF